MLDRPVHFAIAAALVALAGRAQATCNATSALDLAYHWAPVHYQDADSDKYRSDMITRIDFDGDWLMANNWEDAAAWTSNPAAYVYYSVVSTATHWYILYAFYHPQDWTDIPFDQEHENDLEGFLAIVYRDGTTYGKMEGIVTVAHTDFWSYTPSGSHFTANNETIDGTLTMVNTSHPKTFQEAKGHGLYAYGGSNVEDADGIWYYPSLPYLGSESATTPATPTTSSTDANPVAYYKLIDILATGGLWSKRNDANVFASFGTFKGDTDGGCGGDAGGLATCAANSANAPWGWDDGDDGPVFAGEQAFDPAHLVSRYFKTTTSLARIYDCNPYAVEITLNSLYVAANLDTAPDRSDPYFNLFFSDGKAHDTQSGYGDGIVDGDSGAQVSWIWRDPPMYQWLALAGVMPQTTFYTIKTSLPTFRIRVMDWDDNKADDWLMSPQAYYAESATSGTFTYNFSRSQLSVTLVNAPNR